jgi:FkbM family methyltransferase
VHAFEPIVANAELLRHNVEANGFSNIVIHEVALSDRNGTASMTAPHRKADASLTVAGEVTVATAQLDSLELPPPTVVKIDVEGAEVEVLRGMQQALRRDRPVVVVEIHGDREQPVRTVLNEAGYTSVVSLQDGGMPHLVAIPQPRAASAGLKSEAPVPMSR